MRYVIAIVLGIVGALVATIFFSSGIATAVVNSRTFDNPDDVASLHSLVFMVCNVGGLALGWTIGWAIGGALEKEEEKDA